MRFGIDIDGVLANFTHGFWREVNNIWPGRLPINYEPDDWNYTSSGLTKDDLNKVLSRLDRIHNFWLSLPPYPGNVRDLAMHRIHYPEDEIFYVTARRRGDGMTVMHQTQVWLRMMGIDGLGTSVIVDNSGDKCPIFNALECDYNVDDKLEAVEEHHRLTRGAYLHDRPWNRRGRPSQLRVCGSLAEFFRLARHSRGASNAAS